MIDDQQTGRTSRLLLQAYAAAICGNKVIFVCHRRQLFDYVKMLMDRMYFLPGIAKQIKLVAAEDLDDRMSGLRAAIVVVDHECRLTPSQRDVVTRLELFK